MTSTCPNCGSSVAPGARFCPRCGQDFSAPGPGGGPGAAASGSGSPPGGAGFGPGPAGGGGGGGALGGVNPGNVAAKVPKGALATAATAGRIALIPAALFSILALLTIDFLFDVFGITSALAIIASLGMIGLAAIGFLKPARAFDVAALFLAATTAGFMFTIAIDGDFSVLGAFAWLLLIVACAALAAGLIGGEAEVDPRIAAGAQGAIGSIRSNMQSGGSPQGAGGSGFGGGPGGAGPGGGPGFGPGPGGPGGGPGFGPGGPGPGGGPGGPGGPGFGPGPGPGGPGGGPGFGPGGPGPGGTGAEALEDPFRPTGPGGGSPEPARDPEPEPEPTQEREPERHPWGERREEPEEESSGPAPGWYPEPGGDQLRWWDGKKWTDSVRPKEG